MSYLYAYSATWRAIVHESRNPKVLLAFTVATTTGFYLLGRGSLYLTSPATENTEEEMRIIAETDPEMKRYSKNSAAALAALFQSIGKGGKENDKYMDHQMKLPQVQWHPNATKKAQAATNATASSVESSSAASDSQAKVPVKS